MMSTQFNFIKAYFCVILKNDVFSVVQNFLFTVNLFYGF